MQLSRPEQLTQFLARLGERYLHPATIYVFGGSAMLWLGGSRRTADIDVAAYLFDPYSIAVMKIDRAFDTDMEDVQFLIAAGHVDLNVLAQCVEDVAARYDEPLKLRRNFEELKRNLKP